MIIILTLVYGVVASAIAFWAMRKYGDWLDKKMADEEKGQYWKDIWPHINI